MKTTVDIPAAAMFNCGASCDAGRGTPKQETTENDRSSRHFNPRLGASGFASRLRSSCFTSSNAEQGIEVSGVDMIDIQLFKTLLEKQTRLIDETDFISAETLDFFSNHRVSLVEQLFKQSASKEQVHYKWESKCSTCGALV